jgi:hypothetical protein
VLLAPGTQPEWLLDATARASAEMEDL